jgi:hypothetical protein
MLNKEDVVRITEEVLKGLKLEVERGHWTSPNDREIVLKYKGVVIDKVTFDVVQKREYEG